MRGFAIFAKPFSFEEPEIEMPVRKREKIPRTCADCERRDDEKARVMKLLTDAIGKMEAKFTTDDFKPTMGDFLKLSADWRKRSEQERPKEIKVTWVEPSRHPSPRNSLRPAAFAEEVSRVGGAVQGIFGADRQRQEPGAVPGSDPAELHEPGTHGTAGSADLPDAAGRDAGDAVRDSGRQRDSVRAQQGREHAA